MAAIGQKIERADIIDMMWLMRWVIAKLREVERLLHQHAY
jgi:hypothetical protein